MNAGQEKGDRRHFKILSVPLVSSGWTLEQREAPGSAGSLTGFAIVFIRTLLYLDPDKPDRVALKKTCD